MLVTTAPPQNLSQEPTAGETEYPESAFLAMEVVNIILLVVTVWIVISMLIYGTKTGRWINKPGTSSLNSGASYITCFIAVVLTIPKLAMTETLYRYDFEHGDDLRCKLMVDVTAIAYFVSLYAVYLFLWILQRRIYTHPCVKERVNKHVNRFSLAFLFPLTAAFAASLITYNVRAEYTSVGTQDCVQSTDSRQLTIAAVLMALAAITVQIIMFVLFVYPAFRARFSNNEEVENSEHENISKFRKFLSKFSAKHVSPIEMTAKRAVVSSIVIVTTDVIATGIDVVIVPSSAPVAFHTAVFDISSLINAFCMIATFGFGSKILTLFCSNCPSIERRRHTSDMTVTEISNV